MTADLNGDGRLDLVVANEFSNTISVMDGNGDGTFGPKNDFAVGTDPTALAAGDFNGDGHPDIVVSNTGSNTVSVMFGIGGGAFGRTDLAVGASPNGLAVADFNGDGKLDIAVAAHDATNDSVKIFLGNGNGTFASPTTLITDSAGREIEALSNLAVADLNSDGKPDLVVANNKDQPPPPRGTTPSFPNGSVSVLLNGGNGAFAAPTTFAVGASPQSVAIGDFNGDGIPDFAVANNVSQTMNVFQGVGGGGFSAPTTYTMGFPLTSIVAADFNGDGRAELAVSGFNVDGVEIWSAPAGGTLTNTTTYVQIGGALDTGDLNRDGHPDLAAVSTFGSTNGGQTLLNKGDGTFNGPFLISNPGNPLTSQAFADFNGDGILDRVSTNNLGQLEVGLGLGDRLFGDRTTLGPGSLVAAGDFNGDGIPDVVAIGGGGFALYANSPGYDNRAGSAVALAMSAPQQATAGSNIVMTVTALNALGDPAKDFHGTVDLDINGASGGALQYDFTTADAGRHTFVLNLTKAGGDTFSTFALGTAGASTSIVVSPAATAKFVFNAPANAVAGSPFGFSITAEDVFGNIETGYTGTVKFGALTNDTQALLPPNYTFTAADAGSHSFSATLTKTVGSSLPIITATDITTNISSFATIIVAPLAPSGLSMLFVGRPAGFASTVVVTAVDIYGNTSPSYAGTVHLSTTDARVTAPADYTFTATDFGQHVFNITFETAGTQSIAAVDTANAAMTATASDLVTPGTVASWTLSGLPASVTAGTAQNLTVTAFDAFGNVASGYGGTVHFSSSDAAAGLPADYTFNPADFGRHTFSVFLKTAGNQSITVTDTQRPALTASVGTHVTAAAAASLSLTGIPFTTTAGVAQTVTVTLRDAFGNLASGYTGTVHFSSTDPLVSLPASYTFTAADAGVHTFSITLKKAGIQSVTASDAATPALTSTQSASVAAAAVSHFAISAPANVTQGVGFSITVTAVDDFGNINTGYRGSVHFTTSAANAGLPSSFTFSNNDNGTHIFSITINTLGFQTLNITDLNNSAITSSFVVDVLAQSGGGGGGGGGGTT